MVVVAAGVHHADFLPVVLRLHCRLERQVDFLGHRQRVHVRAQRDDRTGTTATEHTDHARVRDAGLHLEPELLQVLGHDLRCAEFAVAEFRVLVKVAAPGDDLDSSSLARRSISD